MPYALHFLPSSGNLPGFMYSMHGNFTWEGGGGGTTAADTADHPGATRMGPHLVQNVAKVAIAIIASDDFSLRPSLD